MWHVIIITCVGEFCVEGRPPIHSVSRLRSSIISASAVISLSHYLTRTPSLCVFLSSLLSSIHISCAFGGRRRYKRNQGEAVWESHSHRRPRRVSLCCSASRKRQRSTSAESNGSFVSIQGMKRGEPSWARSCSWNVLLLFWSDRNPDGAKYAALTATTCAIITTYNNQGPFSGQRKEGDKLVGKIMSTL